MNKDRCTLCSGFSYSLIAVFLYSRIGQSRKNPIARKKASSASSLCIRVFEWYNQYLNGGSAMQELKTIARIQTDYGDKFGIPRQSGLVPEGGNTRMWVFATRSRFRPYSLGLSCVRLEEIRTLPGHGTVLLVSGADLADGTPIYDIKPYLPFTDCRPEASGGFADAHVSDCLSVEFPDPLLRLVPESKRAALIRTLSLDPRPAYQSDPDIPYGIRFAGLDIRFRVSENLLTVYSVVSADAAPVK